MRAGEVPAMGRGEASHEPLVKGDMQTLPTKTKGETMRPEVKGALIIGMIVIATAVVWAFRTARMAHEVTE